MVNSKNIHVLIIQFILTVGVLYTWCSVGLKYVSLQQEHIIALTTYFLLWFSFFIGVKSYAISCFFAFLLGSFNLFSFTPDMYFLRFGLNSKTIDYSVSVGFQPFSFLMLILTLILFRNIFLSILVRIYRA